MDWQDFMPVAAAIGFFLFWFFILPRFGVRTT